MTRAPEQVETPRLLLRRFVKTDLAAHEALMADPLVTRFLPRGPFAASEARQISQRVIAHFMDHWSTHGFGVWALIDKQRGVLIGQCGLNHLPAGDEIEVLYLVERASWGQGLATEAAAAAVKCGFDALELERIVGLTLPGNAASERVLEKVGLRYEKNARFFDTDCRYYACARPARETLPS
jgi:RimJ/RimL family protein N-acetyltransferase